VIPGQLSKFAVEYALSVRNQKLRFTWTARIEQHLPRERTALWIFRTPRKRPWSQRNPNSLAAPPTVDHFSFERQQLSKGSTGKRGKCRFELRVELKASYENPQISHICRSIHQSPFPNNPKGVRGPALIISADRKLNLGSTARPRARSSINALNAARLNSQGARNL